ncbi:hypothetical protein GCM10023160_08160 [Brachybacterium paraconglomeratum]
MVISKYAIEVSFGSACDPLSCASQPCGAGRNGFPFNETFIERPGGRVTVGCGMTVDSDDVSVDVPTVAGRLFMTMFLSNRWDGRSLPASAQDESHYEAGLQ